ncbi:ABC transporter permease [Clostridium ihumii]|uniref:ABC transporter permease n=1 Tax=Clostridium ihumii TaxID=1470356 RepID=UPI00054E9ACB|nr:iron chelate uptake ABC transporter family permease subunit [Clostridium ihumii]
MKVRKRHLVVLLIIFSIISLFLGSKNIGITDVLSGNKESIHLMLVSRVPRLVSILVAGMGMSICGIIMQQISQNKFVSPTTGATIDSAKLGIVVAMIIFPSASIMQKTIISFIFALIGTFIFMTFIRKLKFKNVIFVPLVGIMCGNIIGSMTTFLGYRFDIIQNVNSWMEGNFSMILKGNYELVYLSIPLMIVAVLYANKFTVAGMGEDFAINLGVNYKSVVNLGLIIVALVTVCVIITAGNIPYIGLIVPNIVSLYKGDDVNKIIWDTALFGALFVLVCDIVSRILIYPYEISVGLTVGVIGSITFLIMLFRRNSYAS